MLSFLLNAQVIEPARKTGAIRQKSVNDTLFKRVQSGKPSDSLEIFNPKISDYNYWVQRQPKQIIDTVLTIDNFYKQNVYGKDLFEFQQFSNLGQSLNPLVPYSLDDNLQILPVGKSFMYLKEEDIKYYDVKTPTTEFIFENGSAEGQFLSTTFTHNIHSRFNYAINYRYIKSEGRYLNTLSNNKNVVLSTHYKTKNDRYKLQANFVAHDFNNQENGGLTTESITAFIDDDSNFTKRDRMYTNLSYAQSVFGERRVHLDHQFGIFSFSKQKDSTQTKDFPFYIKHEFNHKHQSYVYQEPAAETYYTSEIINNRRRNRKKFDKFENLVSLGINLSDKLKIEGGLMHQSLKVYYDSAYALPNVNFPLRTRENRFGLQGNMNFKWKENIHLSADGFFTNGDVFGNEYQLNGNIKTAYKNYQLNGGIKLRSSYPSLSYYTHQSFYRDFNYHNPSFKNQTTQELFAELKSKTLGLTLYGSLLNQNNSVYVGTDYLPKQIDGAVNYFKIGAREHYKFGKFGVDVQAQYQKILKNEEYYPVPNIIARATLYYNQWAFNNNAYIQTGLTARYYSDFNSREFFPIINEFMLTDDATQSIGNFPKIDLFFNVKVNRMRIYLRGENMSSFFMRGNYFSTPNQPARDFKIQLGIHWFLFT